MPFDGDPTRYKTNLDRLREARALLADKSRWCQGDEAVDILGDDVRPHDDAAVRWCVLGAYARTFPPPANSNYANSNYKDALVVIPNAAMRWLDRLYDRAGPQRLIEDGACDSIAEYNDTHSHKGVMRLLSKMIKQAEAEEKTNAV